MVKDKTDEIRDVDVENNAKSQSKTLEYGVTVNPPATVTLLYVFQMLLSNIGGPITATFIIHSNICAENNPLLLAEMISTAIFMGGLATFMQVTFGVRLPITQGSSWAFISPILAMMKTEQWRCPNPTVNGTCLYSSIHGDNSTVCDNEPWRTRLNEINGGLIVASAVHVLIGACGVMGFLMRFIGPLTIIPTVGLIGLSLFETVTGPSQVNWGISLGTAAIYMVFSLVMCNISIPFPAYEKKRGFYTIPVRMFRLYPNFLSMLIMWFLCYIFTITGVFTDNPNDIGYMARTDAKIDNVNNMKWFFGPYPGRYGMPTVSIGVFIGMLAAIISSIVESVGDYYATARVCSVPAPAKHAMNRGVAMEGLASMISGLLGVGHATTSYSGTAGTIQITSFGSRLAWQIAGVCIMMLGMFGKFAGAMSIIPDPVIGGTSLVGMGMLVGVALANLQFLDMRSSRNLMILGVSLMLGLMFPFWMADNPDAIDTGAPGFDQVVVVFLSNGMFVGGVVGFVLDNIMPGTKSERGLDAYTNARTGGRQSDSQGKEGMTIYDISYITAWTRKYTCFSYLPFMPSYKERPCCCRKSSKVDKESEMMTKL